MEPYFWISTIGTRDHKFGSQYGVISIIVLWLWWYGSEAESGRVFNFVGASFREMNYQELWGDVVCSNLWVWEHHFTIRRNAFQGNSLPVKSSKRFIHFGSAASAYKPWQPKAKLKESVRKDSTILSGLCIMEIYIVIQIHHWSAKNLTTCMVAYSFLASARDDYVLSILKGGL